MKNTISDIILKIDENKAIVISCDQININFINHM